MQKKIIALAVAAVASGAAFAQSNVTVYGVADAYIGSFKADGKETSTKVNSGGLSTSRIGFKGVEDLGNGLKAIFALEYRLEIDANGGVGYNSGFTGGTNLQKDSSGPARQQLVGLTGGFGTAVAGRLQTTGYDWAVKYDNLAGTAISPLQNVNTAATAAGVSTFLIGGTTLAARADNAVAYISPNFSGVTVAANYAFVNEESAASGAAKKALKAGLLSANYENGPLAVGLVYAKATSEDGNALFAGADVTDWAVGASYNLGVAKLNATYQTSKLSGTGIAAPADNRDSAWSVGAVVPVTAAGNVLVSYAKNSIDSTAANDDKKSWTVAYTHGLSKRTTAYAGYNKVNSDVANSDSSALVAGINHKF